MQDILGGDSKTLMIVQVSPAAIDLGQHSTYTPHILHILHIYSTNTTQILHIYSTFGLASIVSYCICRGNPLQHQLRHQGSFGRTRSGQEDHHDAG
jgi:hypothetical protein